MVCLFLLGRFGRPTGYGQNCPKTDKLLPAGGFSCGFRPLVHLLPCPHKVPHELWPAPVQVRRKAVAQWRVGRHALVLVKILLLPCGLQDKEMDCDHRAGGQPVSFPKRSCRLNSDDHHRLENRMDCSPTGCTPLAWFQFVSMFSPEPATEKWKDGHRLRVKEKGSLPMVPAGYRCCCAVRSWPLWLISPFPLSRNPYCGLMRRPIPAGRLWYSGQMIHPSLPDRPAGQSKEFLPEPGFGMPKLT